MIRLNALRHLLDPVGQKGNPQPFDIGYTKLSTGEYITGRCVCLSSNFKNDTLNDGWDRLLFDRTLSSKETDISKITPLVRLDFVGSGGMGALIYQSGFDASWVKAYPAEDSYLRSSKVPSSRYL
jgi:hypothetical protein